MLFRSLGVRGRKRGFAARMSMPAPGDWQISQCGGHVIDACQQLWDLLEARDNREGYLQEDATASQYWALVKRRAPS